MMPEGVEHHGLEVIRFTTSAVTDSMMPEGVEHGTTGGDSKEEAE